MKSLGYIESGLSDSDYVFAVGEGNVFPEGYQFGKQLPVIDQGNRGICVSVAISEMYNFYCCFKQNNKIDIPIDYLYNHRKNKSIDGMTPREGFEILKDKKKINSYARILQYDYLWKNLIPYGITLIALPVYNFNEKFWIGDTPIGGHAVAVVGYAQDKSLIIKNSWGNDWGRNGYTNLPPSDFKQIIEAWTILT